MSVLPRTLPTAAHQQLAEALAAVGVDLGGIKPGTRVTLVATYKGATWELTYLGHGSVWRATGPGHERGTGVFTNEAADLIVSATDLSLDAPPRPQPAAPRTYSGVVVPRLVLQHWDEPLGDGWRLGVRTTLAAC
ncbi:hypothetical protein [[Kitasatospora] papulosa]|uniref:hypothetical protein n=1 Tax=[Kitasatospora] papulosa TaxID=1464011 RepID=UPI0036C09CCA